jgi:regulator of replication initiation timing
MDNYSELITQMADAYITAVRVLETENARLRAENKQLSAALAEKQAANDIWYEGGHVYEHEE